MTTDGTVFDGNEGRLVTDRLNPISVSIAAAVTFAALNTLCAAAVSVWPDEVRAFFNSSAHGVDLSTLKSTQPFSLFRFLGGLVGLVVVGLVAGAIFAWTHNQVTRE
jgi:hypothetical protein